MLHIFFLELYTKQNNTIQFFKLGRAFIQEKHPLLNNLDALFSYSNFDAFKKS